MIMAPYDRGIKVVVLYYAPSDLPQIRQFFRKIKLDPHFIHSISCPLLIIQGDSDHFIPIESTHKLCQHLKQYNKFCELKIYPNVNHAFNWPDRREYNAELSEKAREDAISFLDKYLKSESHC